MKIRLFLLIFIILGISTVYAQKKTNPKNTEAAVAILIESTQDHLKDVVKSTSDDSLYLLAYPHSNEFKNIYEWLTLESKRTKLKRYFKKRHITYLDYRLSVILTAFKHTMLQGSFDEEKILETYQKKQNWRNYQHENRFTLDTLYNVYIPYDIDDCIRVLDEIFNDTIKKEVMMMKENDFAARAHFGLGLWIRNNWQLWGGSRLSTYFHGLGVFHPDDMSSIILISYHRHICGKDIKLEELLNGYNSE